MEEERAREEIAKWLHAHTVKIRQESIPWLGKTAWEDLPKDTRLDTQKSWREKADEVLAIKLGSRTLKEWIELYKKGKLRIEADDQRLPNNPEPNANDREDVISHRVYSSAQIDMLKPDSRGNVWVKVRPKKE